MDLKSWRFPVEASGQRNRLGSLSLPHVENLWRQAWQLSQLSPPSASAELVLRHRCCRVASLNSTLMRLDMAWHGLTWLNVAWQMIKSQVPVVQKRSVGSYFFLARSVFGSASTEMWDLQHLILRQLRLKHWERQKAFATIPVSRSSIAGREPLLRFRFHMSQSPKLTRCSTSTAWPWGPQCRTAAVGSSSSEHHRIKSKHQGINLLQKYWIHPAQQGSANVQVRIQVQSGTTISKVLTVLTVLTAKAHTFHLAGGTSLGIDLVLFVLW